MRLQSTLTCPACGARAAETMPTDACVVVWDCPACGAVLKPKRGDCCVFCSFGDVPCPPIQAGGACAEAAAAPPMPSDPAQEGAAE